MLKPGTRRIYLFRHGETDWNVEQRFQGHVDIPLNAVGLQQARQLIGPLKRLGIETILSSDLSRAVQTAEAAAQAMGLEIVRDPGLREAHLGDAQGLTWDEIENKFGAKVRDRWRSPLMSDADVSYPGGETGRQVLDRALVAMEKFALRTETRCFGVSTHGGVIRRVVRHIIGENDCEIPIPNGIVYPLEYELESKRWKLLESTPWRS